jgi:hypothetical protein
VLIDYCTSSGRYFLRYELQDVELVGSSITYGEPDTLTETLTFTYTTLIICQRPIDVSGEVMTDRETKTDYDVVGPT